MPSNVTCTAFQGTRRIAAGPLLEVALALHGVAENGDSIQIFDDETSRQVELDLRGTLEDVRARYGEEERVPDGEDGQEGEEQAGQRRMGRPKLGVVAREVTLLPRHWEWLAGQTGGASVALRKLVEEARRAGEAKDRVRRARETAYRFMSAMAGNEPGYEEALRALFAGDGARLEEMTAGWPQDVRAHAMMLAARAQ
jgi:hypothetical protein